MSNDSCICWGSKKANVSISGGKKGDSLGEGRDIAFSRS